MNKYRNIIKKTGEMLLGAAVGILLSKAEILSFSAPLGAVLPTILDPACGIAAISGMALGGLIFRVPDSVAAVLAGSFGLICRRRLKGLRREHANVTVSAVTSSVYLISSAVMSAFTDAGASALPLTLFFSLLLMLTTYHLSSVVSEIGKIKSLSRGQMLFLCGITLCALCPVEISDFPVGGVAAAYFILTASTRFGLRDAVLTSAVCAAAAGLCKPELFPVYALLIIPAIVCGAYGFSSPIKTSAAFLLSLAPAVVIFGEEPALMLLPAACISAAAFVLTSSRAIRLTERLVFSDVCSAKTSSPIPLSEAIAQLADDLRDSEADTSSFVGAVSDAVYARVCINCPENSECFDENNSHTLLTELDSLPQRVEPGDICRVLPNCRKIAEVSAVSLLTKQRAGYAFRRTAENRSAARLCCRMLSSMEKVVEDAAKAADRYARKDEFLTARLSEKLSAAGIKFIDCATFPTGGAEIRIPASARINDARLTAMVASALGTECTPPEHIPCRDTVILRFASAPEYTVSTGFCQLSASKDYSGDVAKTFTAGGHSYTLLSDGMGVGEEARASALTLVRLLQKLVCAGFSVETSAALASSVLGPALNEESFATLDLIRVNLSTGAAEIYKAGGCRSYLCCDGSESLLREGGYPIGILEDCRLRVRRFFVRENAVAVMLTDGADIGGNEISRVVSACKNASPSELAARILQASHPEKLPQKDDISVAVVKIQRICQ